MPCPALEQFLGCAVLCSGTPCGIVAGVLRWGSQVVLFTCPGDFTTHKIWLKKPGDACRFHGLELLPLLATGILWLPMEVSIFPWG